MTADQYFHCTRLMFLFYYKYQENGYLSYKKGFTHYKSIVENHIITQVSNYTQNKLFS